jgi:hypothetical protein
MDPTNALHLLVALRPRPPLPWHLARRIRPSLRDRATWIRKDSQNLNFAIAAEEYAK